MWFVLINFLTTKRLQFYLCLQFANQFSLSKVKDAIELGNANDVLQQPNEISDKWSFVLEPLVNEAGDECNYFVPER